MRKPITQELKEIPRLIILSADKKKNVDPIFSLFFSCHLIMFQSGSLGILAG